MSHILYQVDEYLIKNIYRYSQTLNKFIFTWHNFLVNDQFQKAGKLLIFLSRILTRKPGDEIFIILVAFDF